MNFLKTRIFGKSSLDALVENLPGWYTYEEFAAQLKKEQNRSDRTGLPFSYIQLDISRHNLSGEVVSEAVFADFLLRLTGIISDNTRNFDVKFITKSMVIGVLLIDTSLEGAKTFIEKTSYTLYKYFQAMNKQEYINILQSITISSYPANKLHEADDPGAVPILLKNLRFSQNGDSPPEKGGNTFREKTAFSLYWESLPLSGDVLSMDLSYLWNNIFEDRATLSYRFWKRIIDVIGALIGITLFFPLILAIAIAIKLTSKGPVIFTQQRIGQLRKPFTFYKFRTMKIDADDAVHRQYVQKLIEGRAENHGTDDDPLFKIKRDPRVIRIGHLLRKTSLDEIPQLFNVLKGDMSLVGPRPPMDYEVEKYQSWHLRRIFEARPGVTGVWQVYGRSKTTFDEMVRLDLKYVENRSLFLDIKVILLTFRTIFKINEAS